MTDSIYIIGHVQMSGFVVENGTSVLIRMFARTNSYPCIFGSHFVNVTAELMGDIDFVE